MVQLAVNEQTANALNRLAQARAVPTQQLAEEAIRAYLRAETQRALEREIEAFVHMHAWLLANHAGEYVAFYGGKLVDQDIDQVTLFLRIEERFPDAPVLIRQVRNESESTMRVYSPRLEYG
jgi:predicted transcriptional regulator